MFRPTRRELLRVGTASMLGLSLPDVLRAGPNAAADSCILIFLNGGPSHLDTFDMKPDAPEGIRGEFKPIPSSVSGVPVCEHLPRLAARMHRASLVRSVSHSVNESHALAVYTGLTGHDKGDVNSIVGAGPDDHPSVGSVAGLLRPPATPILPYVELPFVTQEGKGGPPQPGFFGGWLGREHDPLTVTRDPNSPDFRLPELTLGPEMPPGRLDARRRLLGDLGRDISAGKGMDRFRGKAFDLLTSPATQAAFRIDREPPTVRDAYGRNVYGQSVLLSRRLIEAGCRVACLSWAPDANATWDTHGQNFKKLKDELLPQLDMAVSALFDDLAARGLFGRTLVVVMGEFGRTPKVNGDAGRDHWNHCYTAMLAGGGIKPGTVYGASDRIGGRPSEKPVGPADVIATVYACLGIDPKAELHDRLNRPLVLVPWGEPIGELIG